MGRVTYRKAWEKEFSRSPAGQALYLKVAEALKDMTALELRRTGLLDDPPAREYLAELDTANTADGAVVFTTASRAHLVEWGTIYRDADAPMRTAGRRFNGAGRLRGTGGRFVGASGRFIEH